MVLRVLQRDLIARMVPHFVESLNKTEQRLITHWTRKARVYRKKKLFCPKMSVEGGGGLEMPVDPWDLVVLIGPSDKG